MGYYYWQLARKINMFALVVCFMALLILNILYSDGITMNCTYNHIIPYIITGGAGSILIMKLAVFIEARYSLIKKILYYVGNHTLIILALHFLSFKLVSYAITIIYSMDCAHVAEHPVIESEEDSSLLWWIFYSVVGVVFPLIIMKLLELLKRCCYRLINGGINC
jgi:fucose 4-O-acetylase-like acetyltransferase